MAIMRKKNRVGGEIPTSSMADIAFLLLIFFLVTTVFDEERGLQIVLPEPAEQQEVSQKNILHLFVDANGAVRVKRGESPNEQVIQANQLGSIWRLAIAENPNLIAAVKTAGNAPYKYMIDVLDQLQGAGAQRISLQILE
ncbi:MAG TPA: biopolymer transporter ExbD [Longimicrobiales bacterium]|nr:biopolymer transporter ExbD [Longimicrobiales bacterium]